MTAEVAVMGFGYLVALIALVLFSVECRLRAREIRGHARELAERDETIDQLDQHPDRRPVRRVHCRTTTTGRTTP